MTDDTAQSTPAPTEPTPAPGVVMPPPSEQTPPSPEAISTTEPAAPAVSSEPTPTPTESVPVIEHTEPSEPASVILEESQPAQEIQEDSRPVSQPPPISQPSKPVGHKWNSDDRAKSAATQTRKIDARLAKIVEYARAHGGKITNDEIEKLLRVSDATASRYARILISRGILRREGKGRGARYVV